MSEAAVRARVPSVVSASNGAIVRSFGFPLGPSGTLPTPSSESVVRPVDDAAAGSEMVPAGTAGDDGVVVAGGAAAAVPPDGASGHVAPSDLPECVICQDHIHPGSETITIHPCGHTFHQHCVLEWREVSGVADHQCPYHCENSPLFADAA